MEGYRYLVGRTSRQNPLAVRIESQTIDFRLMRFHSRRRRVWFGAYVPTVENDVKKKKMKKELRMR